MKHNRSIHSITAMATLIFGSSFIAFAHDGVEHVMGIIKALSATSITVETVKHETSVVTLDTATKFSNKGVKAALKDLQVGDRVVVDTKDDANDKPHAILVKWGAKTPAKDAGHQMDPKMKMNPKMKM